PVLLHQLLDLRHDWKTGFQIEGGFGERKKPVELPICVTGLVPCRIAAVCEAQIDGGERVMRPVRETEWNLVPELPVKAPGHLADTDLDAGLLPLRPHLLNGGQFPASIVLHQDLA